MAEPITDNKLRWPAEKIPAYAPPRAPMEHPPEPEPLQGGTSISVPARLYMSYAPAQEIAHPQQIVDERKPIGECAHPFSMRWYCEPIDIEGCRLCALSCINGHWERNDDWATAARKIGAIRPDA